MIKKEKEVITIKTATTENDNIIPFEVGSPNAFKRNELERLECLTDEEIKLVLEYQKKLPILIGNEGVEGFCVDARTLWEQLGKPQNSFSHWKSRYFLTYGFEENVDFTVIGQFCPISVISRGGDFKSKNYLLTLDMAKQLSMAMKTPIGRLCRKYYIIIDKAFRESEKWQAIRDPEKAKYKEMCSELDNYCKKNLGRAADKWDYAREADEMNKLVTGWKAKDLRVLYNVQSNELIRDYLKRDFNEELCFLEEQNIIKLKRNMDFETRWSELGEDYAATFPSSLEKVAIGR